jgi:hypothetical protein
MDEKIDKAIETVLAQVRTNLDPDKALKQTQAVLNLMHAKTQWACATQDTPGTKRPKTT